MSEREPRGSPEEEPSRYLRIARFRNEETSGRAYFEAQRAIFKATESDLSSFRLQWEEAWHVVLLGTAPQRTLSRRLDRILMGGDTATLPDELVKLLQE